MPQEVPHDWNEFIAQGGVDLTNRMLEGFGWKLEIEMSDDGVLQRVFPVCLTLGPDPSQHVAFLGSLFTPDASVPATLSPEDQARLEKLGALDVGD